MTKIENSKIPKYSGVTYNPRLDKYEDKPVLTKKMLAAIETIKRVGLPSESLIEEARQISLARRNESSFVDVPKSIATKTTTTSKSKGKISKKKVLFV
jgi:hypothetical protein